MLRAAAIAMAAAGVFVVVPPLSGEEKPLPDLEFRARVRAKEMKFEQVTSVRVRFRGSPGRTTVDRSKRTNLPKPVQPGKVYRDVQVDTETSSTFSRYSSPLTPVHGGR